MSKNVLSGDCHGLKHKVPTYLEQEAHHESIALDKVPETSDTTNERLQDFLPGPLMLLIRIFRLTNPNIRHRWILWIVFFLGSQIEWPFWIIKLVIGRELDLP